MLRANSKNYNLSLSNTSRIEDYFKHKSVDNDKFVSKNFNKNLKEGDKSISNNINININNNTNFYMINSDRDIDKYSSFDSKVLKSILKNKPNIHVPPLNLNKNIVKAVKRVSIEDQILPICVKTKSLSILSLSNLNLQVNIILFL